ncbi:uncharacterized protein LOC143146936 [Ptiloglossa arizonensis]|uniref:uncharacterized protein LOC143146936 n=1 Tax=Ptiloglossa arizonensis TaxID=3350558 RepID=UPI003FA0D468
MQLSVSARSIKLVAPLKRKVNAKSTVFAKLLYSGIDYRKNVIDFITPFTEQCSCLKRFTLVPGTNDRSSRASRALGNVVHNYKCQIQLSREMSKEGSKPSNAQRDETRHDDAGSKRRQREKEVLVSFHVPATLSCSLEPYGSSFTPIAVHRRAR